MKTSKIAVVTAMMLVCLGNLNAAPQTKLPDAARAEQVKDLKFGMFVCWSFSTFYGKEWTPTLGKDASYFKATGCDTDQWCKTAKDAGMKVGPAPTKA